MHNKTRVLTRCGCAGSGAEIVMEDVKGDKCVHTVDKHIHKNKSTLTRCGYAGSGEESVTEDVKRDKFAYTIDKHIHKNKSAYSLVVVQVVVKKLSWRM